MTSVTFPPAIGGDGSTVSDDDNPTTGLKAGGHRTRFIPALVQMVAIVNWIVAFTNSIVTAVTIGVTTIGNSTTSLAISIASKSLTMETGKQFSVGQWVVVASKANPSNQMVGNVTAFNSAAGTMTVNVTLTGGSGTLADWTISLTPPGGALSAHTDYAAFVAQNKAQAICFAYLL